MRAPTLVPGTGTTTHLVLNDLGALGRAYLETDEAKADEWTIVRNIANGHCVVAFNVAEGWSRDVTRQIAEAVFELGRRENYFSQPARDFVERVLGIALFPTYGDHVGHAR
jgi:hypothetical protein